MQFIGPCEGFTELFSAFRTEKKVQHPLVQRLLNPAKEDQATARAYRIGQTRTVQVYYPGVVSDRFPSFDVRLDVLLCKKRALAADMLNGCSDLKASDFADFW